MPVLPILLALFQTLLWAQDERIFREMVTVDPPRGLVKGSPLVRVFSPHYTIDIDADGTTEYIRLEKRDGADWIHIHDHGQRPVFSSILRPKGSHSGVYKIERRQTAQNHHILLVHYYEGYTKSYEFHGTARLYIISGNSTLSMTKGPLLFEEKTEARGHYHQRAYKIKLVDLNDDGFKDINVHHGDRISRTLVYQGEGVWQTFRKNFLLRPTLYP